MGDPITLKRDALPLSVLLAMVLLFTQAMILEGRLPFLRDLGVFFYPMRYSLAQSLLRGELPLWNRQIGMGFPLLANLQSESFYLPHLLFLVLPFLSALSAIFVLHYLIAACGSYFLCRNWGYSPCLAMTGSILFTFGGTMVSLSNLVNHFQAAVWLPWIVFFWERYLQRQSWPRFLLLTLFLLLQFLAGSPEIYLMTLGFVVLDTLRWRSQDGGPGWLKITWSVLGANVLLLCVAMVQVLPTLELIEESRREFPIPFQLAAKWSLHPWQLINLLFLDREVVADRLSGMEVLFGPPLPFFVTYYVGAASCLGVALWLYYAGWRERLVVGTVVALSLVLAFGEYTPVFKFLFVNVPGFRMIRFPEKFFFVTYVIILFASVRGFQGFLGSRPKVPKPPLILLLTLCGSYLGVYLLLQWNTPAVGRFFSQMFGVALLSESTATKTAMLLLSLERQVLLLLVIVGLLILTATGRLRGWIFSSMFVATVFFDLHSAHQPYQFLLNPEVIRKIPTHFDTAKDEPSRLFYYPAMGNLHPSYFSFLRKPRFDEFNVTVFDNLLPNTGLFHGLEYMQEFDALIRWPYNTFLFVGNQLPYENVITLLSSLNVRFLVSFTPLPEHNNLELLNHFEQYPSWHYRLKSIVPRTYVVDRVDEETNPVSILKRLASPEFNPFTSVMLDRPVRLPESADFIYRSKIISYESQSVAIRASLSSPGVLVVADSYYPGWKAYVGDKEVPIYRANLLFRGVALPAGDHVVTFRYEPASFKIGLIISLTTIALLTVISFFVGFRRRKQSTVFRPTEFVHRH